MPKIRITIEGDYDFDDANFTTVYDKNGTEKKLTQEEVSNLSDKEKLEYEKHFMNEGAFSLVEMIEATEVDYEDDVKFEVVDEQ